MKSILLFCLFGVLAALPARAADSTPPTLNVTHAWIEKTGSIFHFKLMLDPRDETGFNPPNTIFFRSKLNTTAALPSSTPYQHYPWVPGQPMTISFNCTAIVIEVEARDAAGNKSALQRRTFQAPFPISPAPNLNPRFGSTTLSLPGGPIDCRGLFAGNFDGGPALGDDICQVDRTSGSVLVRRQDLSPSGFTDNIVVTLAPNTIEDSAAADLDGDGRLDLVILAANALKYYHNDGVGGSGALEFTETALPAFGALSMTTLYHVTTADITGDGHREIVISGNGDDGIGNTVAKIAWLINNGNNSFATWHEVLAPAGANPGRLAAGDVTGDGATDVVMIDPAGNQLIVFQNDTADTALAGPDDPLPALHPFTAPTGGIFSSPAHSLAVGDVTGDGRADVAITFHWFGSSNSLDSNDTRDHLFWQLFDSRGNSLHENNFQFLGQSPASVASSTPFQSDVIIQDLTKDRFPELIVTNPFEAGAVGQPLGGIRAFRVISHLGTTNELTFFDLGPAVFHTGKASPHRLAAPRFSSNTTRDVLVANGDTPSLQWIFNTSSSIVAKPTDIIGGASTESDPEGTPGPNGIYSYFEHPNGVIDYSLTYVNNTLSPLTNATIRATLPLTVEFLPAESDSGFRPGTGSNPLPISGSLQLVEWTETIPAGTAGVKRFRVRVKSTVAAGVTLKPALALLVGTTVKASSFMPVVTIDEPIKLELVRVETTSDPFNPLFPSALVGQSVHFDETITYKFKVTNNGNQAITNTVVGMAIPPGTLFDGPVSNFPPGTTVSISSARIDYTVLSLAAGASIELFVNVEVREKIGALVTKVGGFITNSTITAQRPSGLKRTLPPVKTLVAPNLEITVEADKEEVSPGETIQYTLRAKNWGASLVTSAKVMAQIPQGTKLVSAHGRDSSGNFTDSGAPLPAFALTQTTNPGYFIKYLFELPGKPATPPRYLLQWNLGDIEAGEEVLVQYLVIVGADTPTTFYIGGTPSGLNAVTNYYNFYATTSSGARTFANTPLSSVSLTDPFNALPKSPVVPAATELVPPSVPVNQPALALTKTAVGPRDASAFDPADSDPDTAVYPRLNMGTIGYESYFTVLKNATYSYSLHCSNYGNGTATNAFIHDEIPANTTFLGFIAKDRRLMESLVFSRFYNAANLEVPAGGEVFWDNNSNGKWDPASPGKAAEWFHDGNGNGKYDGITAIRSFDLYVGNLPSGEFHRFFYQVQVNSTVNTGVDIISAYGGIDGLPNGLDFSAKQGYYMTAENLYFPVNGGPHQVKVKVVTPVRGELLRSLKGSPELANTPSASPAFRGRGPAPGSEVVTMTMPFDIRGPNTVSNASVFMDVPAGYQVVDAVLKDSTGANVMSYIPNATPAQKLTNIWNSVTTGLGPCRVTFPVGSRRFGWPVLKLRFDPAKVNTATPNATLFETNGATKIPLVVKVKITGTGMVTQSGQIQIDARGNTDKDTKVFVGRAVRMSAQRENELTYVIFLGNLQNTLLLGGSLSMNVPAGCDFVSCSEFINNFYGGVPSTDFSIPRAQGKHDAKTRKVTWAINGLSHVEAGAVTMTVRIRKDFTGNRIDDNTCILKLNAGGVQKSPGPISVAVRSGNLDAQAGEVVQRCLQGGGYKSNDAVVYTLATNLALGEDSCNITIGGADYLQLNNGVVIIPLAENRVMLLAPHGYLVPNNILVRRIVAEIPGLQVGVGPGGPAGTGLDFVDVPTYPAGIMSPNQVLRDLATSDSVLKNGGANLVSGNGLNLVRSGGADFTDLPPISSSNPNLILPGPDESLPVPGLLSINTAATQGLLRTVSPVAPGVVRAGNGSAALSPVPGQPGLILAGGPAGVVANDGAGLIGSDAASLVGQDAASVVANDGAGVVANDGAGLIGLDGASIIGQDGASVVSNDGAGIVAGGGGNIVAGGGGNIVAGGGGN